LDRRLVTVVPRAHTARVEYGASAARVVEYVEVGQVQPEVSAASSVSDAINFILERLWEIRPGPLKLSCNDRCAAGSQGGGPCNLPHGAIIAPKPAGDTQGRALSGVLDRDDELILHRVFNEGIAPRRC